MIHDEIVNALRKGSPAGSQPWEELEQMATASPEAAIDLILELASTPLAPLERGWLAVGPLRTAISSATETEEDELEARASADSTLAAMLDALIRYEKKQLALAALLETETGSEIGWDEGTGEIVIPNIHERSEAQSLDEEAWAKIVRAVESAPDGQLFMLASTILETLLLQNESTFRDAILGQVNSDRRFREALSYCELAFSEPFLDDLIGALKSEG